MRTCRSPPEITGNVSRRPIVSFHARRRTLPPIPVPANRTGLVSSSNPVPSSWPGAPLARCARLLRIAPANNGLSCLSGKITGGVQMSMHSVDKHGPPVPSRQGGAERGLPRLVDDGGGTSERWILPLPVREKITFLYSDIHDLTESAVRAYHTALDTLILYGGSAPWMRNDMN